MLLTLLDLTLFTIVTTATVSASQFLITRLNIDKGYALVGHGIKTLPLFKPDCMDECQLTLACFSMNFYKHENGSDICELNRSTKKQSPKNFTRKIGYDYGEIPDKTFCERDDCTPGKEALPDMIYMFNFTRFRFWNLVKTWDEARSHCQSLGDELASFRSELESRFVFETMVSMTDKLEYGETEALLKLRMDGHDPGLELFNGAKFNAQKTALYLNGVTSYARIPRFEMYNTSFTFGVWIKIMKTQRYHRILSDLQHGKLSFKFQLINMKLGVNLYYPGDKITSFQSVRSVPVKKWFNLAVTYDLDTRKGIIFVNGKIDKVKVALYFSRNLVRYKNQPYFFFGTYPTTPNNLYGFIKDLNWIHRVLEPSEVTKLKDGEQRAWIGLNDKTTESVLQWSDGSPMTYEPLKLSSNRDKQDCATLVGSPGLPGHIEIRDCREKSFFICKKN